MASILAPPGVSDIFPDEIPRWRQIEDAASRIFPLYGYSEIRTPIFEFTELFQRGIGSETDVVRKEMYTFEDKGGRSLTLRPEGTAGVVRALTSGTDLAAGVSQRVFYFGPMFRGEKPAAGRRRQFHQVGVENAGTVSAAADAESVAMLMHFLEEVGIVDSTLLVNTRGSLEDREKAEIFLSDFFVKRVSDLCEDCRERVSRNVWRVVDCKRPGCREVVAGLPDISGCFSSETRDFFAQVCGHLDTLSVEYRIEPRLVRGLDYYAHTVFEVTHSGLGAQDSVAGGGRYEITLPNTGKPIHGVGFALGVERIMLCQNSLGIPAPGQKTPEIFIVSLGDAAKLANFALASRLRHRHIPCVCGLEGKSM
ncbi:MAG: histidine--tRNA ligase, partial [Victivallales bacterium]|nr:histidine--tRNA ligase [Victivallales bacterium]